MKVFSTDFCCSCHYWVKREEEFYTSSLVDFEDYESGEMGHCFRKHKFIERPFDFFCGKWKKRKALRMAPKFLKAFDKAREGASF